MRDSIVSSSSSLEEHVNHFDNKKKPAGAVAVAAADADEEKAMAKTSSSNEKKKKKEEDGHDEKDGKNDTTTKTNASSQSQPDNNNDNMIPTLTAAIANFSEGNHRILPTTSDAKRKHLLDAWRQQGSNKEPTKAQVSQVYAPLHLQTQFEDLYMVLHPSLVRQRRRRRVYNNNNNSNNNTTNKKQKKEGGGRGEGATHVTTTATTNTTAHQTNAAAFLQGSRGSGKSLLLERCLLALEDECSVTDTPPFRTVRLHGILTPGTKVSLVVQEMLRQLSSAAYADHKDDDDDDNVVEENVGNGSPTPTTARSRSSGSGGTTFRNKNNNNKRGRKSKSATSNNDKGANLENLLRLRQTTFTNHLQLFNEILKYACLDGLPILFILDEWDAFVETPEHNQGSSSSTSFLGGTDSLTKERQLLLYHLLDRVATEGSLLSLVGLTSHHGTVDLLEKRVRSRATGTSRFIQLGPVRTLDDLRQILLHKLSAAIPGPCSQHLVEQLTVLLTEPPEQSVIALMSSTTNATSKETTLRRRVFEALERSHRLGKDLRWFSAVFSTALSLFLQDVRLKRSSLKLPPSNKSDTERPATVPPPSFEAHYLMEALTMMGASFLTDAGEANLLQTYNNVAANPRIQILQDLRGPQVAVALAARRILVRDGQRDENAQVALTWNRILSEYKTTYRGNTNRYAWNLLWMAFCDLMEMGLLRFATEHGGTAPLQYDCDPTNSVAALSPITVEQWPLHFTVDVHREFKLAMEQNILECSAALREWGKKTN